MGFANLPNQVHRKSVKKGFEFTLMVVGRCDFVILLVVIKYIYISFQHLLWFVSQVNQVWENQLSWTVYS